MHHHRQLRPHRAQQAARLRPLARPPAGHTAPGALERAGCGVEVRRLCSEKGRGGGYILAPAKGLQPETPTENAVAVFEALTNQDERE